MIVENRTGGDGLIGIKSVMNAAPDGTTILITTGPTMYLLPMVEAKPSFDHAKDFVPVSLLGRFEFGVVSRARQPTRRISGSSSPGSRPIRPKSSFGVPSNGTIPHFTGSRLEAILGIPMTRVPYRGGAPIVKDLVGGHLPFAVITVADAIAQHRAGARAHPRGRERDSARRSCPTCRRCGRTASSSSPTPGTACGCRPAARRISPGD